MCDDKKLTVEQLKGFLQNGYDKKFVNDWLKLARSESESITKANKLKNEYTPYLKFFAFFVPFKYLVDAFTFKFTSNKNNEERSIEKGISVFIKQLTSKESIIYLKDYNPLEMVTHSALLKKVENKDLKIKTIEALFINISLVHREIFRDFQISNDMELLDECNLVLDDFFNKFYGVQCN